MTSRTTKMLGDAAEGWGTASASQTISRVDAERDLIKFMRLGYIKNYDELKAAIEKL